MKKNYTHLGVLLDESGSMYGTKNDVIGGFNNLIEEQKKLDGQLTLSLSKFNSYGCYEKIYDMTDIKNVVKLNDKNYSPGGGTALLDSAHKLISEIGIKLKNLPENERPEKVLITIITDGYENDSKEISKSKLLELINQQTDKYNWQFAYIGANQDSIAEGSSLGIYTNTVNYSADSLGTAQLFKGMSSTIGNYRSSTSTTFSLSQNDIDNA